MGEKKKKAPEVKRVLIGKVAVDSGQLMVCDPCYIESQWKNTDFQDIRIYEDVSTGKQIQYGKDFVSYEQTPKGYDLTVNELMARKLIKKVAQKKTGEFSYNGCAQMTIEAPYYGELKFGHGAPGAGIVFSSGHGDGFYPVYATIVDGLVAKVEIVMIDIPAKEEVGS